MINKFFYYILYIMCFVICAHGYSINNSLSEHLAKKYAYVDKELNLKIPHHAISRRDTQKRIEFHNIRSVTQTKTYVSAHSFSLFNSTYILLNWELYSIIPKDGNVTLEGFPTFSRFLDKVSLIKTTEYKKFGFVLISFQNGFSNIYMRSRNSTEYTFVQSLDNPSRIEDAHFFLNQGSLYLVISTTEESFLMPITVYKWQETYFDEIYKTLTRGACGLLTFPNLDSEIIFVLQNSSYISKHQSIVYDFSFDTLKRMQIIKTKNPKFVLTWTLNNESYAAIFDQDFISMLWWDGSEFVEFGQLDPIPNIEKTLVIYMDSNPLVFIVTKVDLKVYAPTTSNFTHLGTVNLKETYRKIVDLKTIKHGNKDEVLILGQTVDKQLDFTVIEFSLYLTEMVSKTSDRDPVLQCLLDLEYRLNSTQTELNLLEKKSEKILEVNQPAEIDGRLNMAAPVIAQAAVANQESFSTKYFQDALRIVSKIELINARIEKLLPKLEDLFHLYDTTINGTMLVRGALHASNLTAKNLFAKRLNSVRWTPEQWLSYSKPQNITGLAKIKTLTTRDLHTPEEGTIFDDVLLREGGEQKLTGYYTVKSLTSTGLHTENVNGIPFQNTYLRGKPRLVTGVKQFQNLDVENMKISYLNGHNASDIIKLFADPKTHKYKFGPVLHITDLYVDTINNVDWKSFKDSVFQIGKINAIKGSLSIPSAKIDKLFTGSINGVNTEEFLTTTTDQTITSNIKFGTIEAKSISCNTINGISMSDEVIATTNRDINLVKGPVILDHLYVSNVLHVNGVDISNLKLKGNHIVGTDESDLLQFYDGKVKIIGNLHLENAVLPNNARLVVNGNDFNLANLSDYWRKSVHQVITVPVEIQNGVTTPELVTKFLNHVEVKNYMINDLDDKLPTSFHFENVTIVGNITIHENKEHEPNLGEIKQNAVKLNGEFRIKGRKHFNGTLKVDSLLVQNLDNVDVGEVITKYSESISGTKTFEHLVIKGDLNATEANINFLNDVDLNKIYSEVVLCDDSTHFENLDFEQLTVENLEVRKINNKLFNEYVLTIDKIRALDTIHNLEVIGSVTTGNVDNLSHINGVDARILMGNIGNSRLVKGNTKFMDKVYVKDLRASIINDVNMKDLTRRLFYRNFPQKITGRYSFKILRSQNLLTPQINDVNVENLINTEDRNPQILYVKNGLHLKSAKFLKSLNAGLPCDLKKLALGLRAPPTRFWATMKVFQNVSILDEDETISHLLRRAVTTKKNNVITGPVTFANIFATSVSSVKHINNIDIEGIYEDALLKHESDQLVTGFKQFVSLTTAGAVVLGNAEIPVINKIVMTQLNQSIIQKNDINNIVVKGRKIFFEGLQTRILNTPSVLGLDPDNLVSLENLRPIPHAVFDSLYVLHNFHTDYVNNVNFTEFISDRLLINSPYEEIAYGTYYFDEIRVKGTSVVPEINHIKLEDVVFDIGTRRIPSAKTFNQGVDIFGDIEVGLINGVNISEKYEQAILYNRNATIKGDIVFLNVTDVNNNITAENINGVPVDYIKEMLESQAPKTKANIAHHTIQKIENAVSRSFEVISDLPDKYMYLERSTELQISIPNTISAQIMATKGDVMLYIAGEQPGYTCGLPSYCNCPTQHAVEITPENSINIFPSKDSQRVFSYETDDISIQIATNSVSSSSICRHNGSLPENATLIWTTNSPNNTGRSLIYPEYISGFIRGVEFFSLDGYTYAIISTFYDRDLDTHSLECLVFAFTKHEDKVELVQKINTKGSWTLHLLHTAQGVDLIIGNLFNSERISTRTSGASTDIYRFDTSAKQFTLLRNVPGVACVSAVGVVLQSDILIVLAQRKGPMLVLKYNRLYQNYYLYQSFVLESPVLEVSVFYTRGSGISDAYLCAVTETSNFYIYTFQYIQGWKLESHGELEGLRALIPFTLNKRTYLFAPSTKISSLLNVVKYG